MSPQMVPQKCVPPEQTEPQKAARTLKAMMVYMRATCENVNTRNTNASKHGHEELRKVLKSRHKCLLFNTCIRIDFRVVEPWCSREFEFVRAVLKAREQMSGNTALIDVQHIRFGAVPARQAVARN